MKKKTGINSVNKDIIKLSMPYCGDHILKIFNTSLSSGTFPNIWKFSVVIPIQKVNRTVKSQEFRPINKAHPLDQALQTIVKVQLELHLQLNSILSDFQSAFRGNHSCETAINLILLKWKIARMKKKKVIAVFLDLRRAFETVDCEILCLILV